jgi:hypothetical protein
MKNLPFSTPLSVVTFNACHKLTTASMAKTFDYLSNLLPELPCLLIIQESTSAFLGGLIRSEHYSLLTNTKDSLMPSDFLNSSHTSVYVKTGWASHNNLTLTPQAIWGGKTKVFEIASGSSPILTVVATHIVPGRQADRVKKLMELTDLHDHKIRTGFLFPTLITGDVNLQPIDITWIPAERILNREPTLNGKFINDNFILLGAKVPLNNIPVCLINKSIKQISDHYPLQWTFSLPKTI